MYLDISTVLLLLCLPSYILSIETHSTSLPPLVGELALLNTLFILQLTYDYGVQIEYYTGWHYQKAFSKVLDNEQCIIFSGNI